MALEFMDTNLSATLVKMAASQYDAKVTKQKELATQVDALYSQLKTVISDETEAPDLKEHKIELLQNQIKALTLHSQNSQEEGLIWMRLGSKAQDLGDRLMQNIIARMRVN